MSDNTTALWTREAQLKQTRLMWVGRIDRFDAARLAASAQLVAAYATRNGFDADLFVKRIADAEAKIATALAAIEAIDAEYADVIDQIWEAAAEYSS
jgi:multidrug resistance efflux pump